MSCLSVRFVHCGQTVGWIKTKLGMQAGLSPGHTVLDGDPPPPPQSLAQPPIFGPFLLWPNGWMHQDATWYGARPQPEGLGVRWGPRCLPKKGAEPPHKFSAHVYCGQTAGWIKMKLGTQVGLGAGHTVLDGDPAPLPKGAHPRNIWPISVAAKWLHGSRCHLIWT